MNPFDAGIANLLPGSMPLAPKAPAPPVNIDVDQRLFALLGNPLEAVTDTTWTNLSSFSGHGGKLLFYHGLSDQAFSAMDTLDSARAMRVGLFFGFLQALCATLVSCAAVSNSR